MVKILVSELAIVIVVIKLYEVLAIILRNVGQVVVSQESIQVAACDAVAYLGDSSECLVGFES